MFDELQLDKLIVGYIFYLYYNSIDKFQYTKNMIS